MMPIEFTETIHDVPKIDVAFNTQPRQELSICTCKAKGHFSANFAKSKYEMLMLHFCQYHTNPTIQTYKNVCKWCKSKFKQCIVILIVQLQAWSGLKSLKCTVCGKMHGK